MERHLSEHQIPLMNDAHPALFRLKVAVVLGFLGNIAFSFWLRFNTSFSFLVVVLISFGLGIMMTLVLERYRGVSQYGKYKPIIEPPKDDEIGGRIQADFEGAASRADHENGRGRWLVSARRITTKISNYAGRVFKITRAFKRGSYPIASNLTLSSLAVTQLILPENYY